jgi:hypothetical protein
MRFIIMHKTNAHWESGAIPGPGLIARVGAMLGRLGAAGVLVAGEGLRPSSQGARLVSAAGSRTTIKGAFPRHNELPAGFSIIRARSLEEAVEWAERQADILGDGEIDIRPVTEPWDIGMAAQPADVATRRYMVLRKATPATEAGEAPSPGQRAELARFTDESTSRGTHVVTESMRPSRRGRRCTNTREGVAIHDGPFTESKELIGGYVIVSANSLDEATRWAVEYTEVVDAEEVDVRELE